VRRSAWDTDFCTPQRPVNPEALAALQAQFTAIRQGKPHRWTREDAVALGTLYIAAWGELPRTTRMTGDYALPARAIIVRLFGSYDAYYRCLEEHADVPTLP
jgi:hypothetical protein